MRKKEVNITEIHGYIKAAFSGDHEIVQYYDKTQKVKSCEEATENVFTKIDKNYPDAKLIGIAENEEPIGYFAYNNDLLISFGINMKYRERDSLVTFWELIKSEMPKVFQCVLYSHNSRAINYLEKSGMDIVLENVTILQFSSN